MTDRQFTAAELVGLRTAQNEHMLDTGLIQTRTQTTDSFGQFLATYADGAAMACGLDMRPGTERSTVDMTMTIYDATLRIPTTAAPTVGDRFKITKRFGETLGTALVYEIVSPIQRGPSGLRLLLRKVDV